MFLSDDFVLLAIGGALLAIGAQNERDSFIRELGHWVFASSIVFFAISALFDYTTAPDPIITIGYMMLTCGILMVFMVMKGFVVLNYIQEVLRKRR